MFKFNTLENVIEKMLEIEDIGINISVSSRTTNGSPINVNYKPTIGIIFFTDKIEKFIPPKKGKTHILRIIRELIEFKPENKKTNIELALKYLTNVIKKKSIVFLISDFLSNHDYKDAIKIANKKHDLVALRIIDKTEMDIPQVGLMKLKDNESGNILWIDTNDKLFRKQFATNKINFESNLKEIFNRAGIDSANINTHESYIKPLMNLFKKR